MKRILWLLVLMVLQFLAYAQEYRLFLADQYNGNYTELELNKEITLALNGVQQSLTGKIVEVRKKSIIVQTPNNEFNEILVDNITSIIELKKLDKVKNSAGVVVVKVLVGTFIGLYGVAALIGGIVLIADEPTTGIPFVIIGGLLTTASYSLFNSAFNGTKDGKLTPVLIPMDGERYRLTIQ